MAGDKHVLLVGVEKLSDLTDPTDRGIAFIFGDGAGAMVIGPSDIPAIGPVVWGSDGEQTEAITQDVPWTTLREEPDACVSVAADEGPQVFRWAVYEMSKVANRRWTLRASRRSDLDVFIPHQANMRITDAMIKQLRLPRRSSSRETSPRPATPRPPRFPWPWAACSRRARSRAATPRC